MTTEIFTILKQIYSSASIPTAVTDENFNVIWRNPPAEENRCLLSCDNLLFIYNGNTPSPGTVCFADDETITKLNVMRTLDPDGRPSYIIECLGKDDINALLNSPDVRSYVTYICAKIRESALMISVSADEIENAVLSADCSEVSDQLNTINRGIMLLLREVIDPEQLYYVLDPCCNDSTICVADELSQAVSDAKRSLGKTTKVICLTEKGIYTRMNRSVFETIISDMTAECCSGKLFPEELIFSCEKTASERAAITITCVNRSGRKNAPSDPETNKKGSKLYFNYLCDVLCNKYGAVFTRRENADGYSCRMEITAIRSSTQIVMNDLKFNTRSGRFSSMMLSLAEHHLEEHYKKAKLEHAAD